MKTLGDATDHLASLPAKVEGQIHGHGRKMMTTLAVTILCHFRRANIPFPMTLFKSEAVSKGEVLSQGFYRITARYGFMESTNVPAILERAREFGLEMKPLDTSYYLGREQLLATGASKLARWRKKLFVFMSKNSRSATAFYGIPPNRVVELGAQLEF